MESAITNLEASVKKADGRLDNISWKLDRFDREICHAVDAEGEQVAVMNLLDSVTQVKEEYEQLKQEISEVQELERMVRDSLRSKVIQAQQTVTALRAKINNHHNHQ